MDVDFNQLMHPDKKEQPHENLEMLPSIAKNKDTSPESVQPELKPRSEKLPSKPQNNPKGKEKALQEKNPPNLLPTRSLVSKDQRLHHERQAKTPRSILHRGR